MEHHFELRNKTREPQTCGEANGRLAPQSREGRKFRYRLKFEKADVSHTDFYSESVENMKPIPPTSGEFQQKHQADEKGRQNEELVRYMSNLPSFLERGKHLPERAFNVGVLDWRLLEKWQHSNNIVNRHSPSSSNTSSFSTTEGSSSRSSRGHSCSPARQKMQHPTLQSHLYDGSPAYSHDSGSSEGNDPIFQDRKAVPSGSLNVQQSIVGCKGKDADLQRVSGTRRSQGLEDLKGKMKIQDCESLKRRDDLQASVDDITDLSCTGKEEKIVLAAAKDRLENRCSPKPQLFVSAEKKNLGLKAVTRRSFSSVDNSEVFHTKFSCDAPRSFPPLEADTRHSQIEQPCFSGAKSNIFSTERNQRVPNCGNISVCPSGGKKLQEKTSITALKDTHEIKPSEGSNLKMGTEKAPKVRNPSPTRRFSISMGRIGRNSSSSATSTIQQSSAKNPTVISGAEEAGMSTAIGNKSNANGKGRSSPLRRLLEPLIKPKAVNSDRSAGASLSDSTSRNRACKSSDGRGESAALHSVKIKLDLKNCKKIDAEDPHCTRKDGSSTVQALLQVAVKNGLPLFTFAVENKSDILAATMRKLSSSEKAEYTWIYTFFFIHEMKKKNGSRVNQGSKDRGNGYIPNVVAQMNATDDLTKPNTLDQSIFKEFVLFAMDRRQDQQTSDLQLNEELAAIVVKVPKRTTGHSFQNRQRNENCNVLSTPSLKEPFQDARDGFESGNNEENYSTVPSEDRLKMTVIFPGGNHGVPIKGEPSSLIKRWKSGGSCDCGGWDLGCQLRVLANHTRGDQESSSIKTQRRTAGRFELFSQGEELDQKPVFSLSPFKDGIFSVEFDSSVKVLQAFSVSLAVLSCLKPAEFSETSNLFADKPSGDVTASEAAEESKVCSRAQVAPLSPVGRV